MHLAHMTCQLLKRRTIPNWQQPQARPVNTSKSTLTAASMNEKHFFIVFYGLHVVWHLYLMLCHLICVGVYIHQVICWLHLKMLLWRCQQLKLMEQTDTVGKTDTLITTKCIVIFKAKYQWFDMRFKIRHEL